MEPSVFINNFCSHFRLVMISFHDRRSFELKFTGLFIKQTGSMPYGRVFLGRFITLALNGLDMQKLGAVHILDVVENADPEVPEEKASSLSIDKLRRIGLNVDAGLMYTCNDEAFYMELLSDYAKSASDKCSDLSSFLENNDLKNYEILVHSLKSASKTVGADDVSEQARALEEASRNQDSDFVKANHDAFVTSFKELSERILG